MAYINKNMSVIAYANGFTLWHYKTDEDTIQSIIDDKKYFSMIYTLCAPGDIIILNAKDGTQFLVIDNIKNRSVQTRRM